MSLVLLAALVLGFQNCSADLSSKTPVSESVTAPATSTTRSLKIPAGVSWYWQLQGAINTTHNAKVYDIDMFNTAANEINNLKNLGHIVICYFSAGTYEPGRPDASQFPSTAIGNKVAGWPGELWLDVRHPEILKIMSARLDFAKNKGCDGVEPDNVDGYTNNPGFPLTAQHQIAFNKYLAEQAHARGLVIGLKNSTDLVSSLVSSFDFAVVEQCFQYKECEAYLPFVQQNKAVLIAEYSNFSASTCSQSSSMNLSTAFYNLNLDGAVFNPCWTPK